MNPLPLPHRPHALAPIGWLLLLHVLADLAVALYRCVNLDAALTDLLAAELPRSQLCLLAIWLALGREPLSWRICGLLAGTSLMFTLFTRLLFPGRLESDPADYWFKEEWGYFFRHSGPGDLLAAIRRWCCWSSSPCCCGAAAAGSGLGTLPRVPAASCCAACGCSLASGIWRSGSWRSARRSWPPFKPPRTPAGSSNFARRGLRATAAGGGGWYSRRLGLPYAVSAFGVLWAVFSERRLPLRIAVASLVVAAGAGRLRFRLAMAALGRHLAERRASRVSVRGRVAVGHAHDRRLAAAVPVVPPAASFSP